MGWDVTARPEVFWVASCSESSWDGVGDRGALGRPCEWSWGPTNQHDAEEAARLHWQAHADRYRAYNQAMAAQTPWPPPGDPLPPLGPEP